MFVVTPLIQAIASILALAFIIDAVQADDKHRDAAGKLNVRGKRAIAAACVSALFAVAIPLFSILSSQESMRTAAATAERLNSKMADILTTATASATKLTQVHDQAFVTSRQMAVSLQQQHHIETRTSDTARQAKQIDQQTQRSLRQTAVTLAHVRRLNTAAIEIADIQKQSLNTQEHLQANTASLVAGARRNSQLQQRLVARSTSLLASTDETLQRQEQALKATARLKEQVAGLAEPMSSPTVSLQFSLPAADPAFLPYRHRLASDMSRFRRPDNLDLKFAVGWVSNGNKEFYGVPANAGIITAGWNCLTQSGAVILPPGSPFLPRPNASEELARQFLNKIGIRIDFFLDAPAIDTNGLTALPAPDLSMVGGVDLATLRPDSEQDAQVWYSPNQLMLNVSAKFEVQLSHSTKVGRINSPADLRNAQAIVYFFHGSDDPAKDGLSLSHEDMMAFLEHYQRITRAIRMGGLRIGTGPGAWISINTNNFKVMDDFAFSSTRYIYRFPSQINEIENYANLPPWIGSNWESLFPSGDATDEPRADDTIFPSGGSGQTQSQKPLR